MEDPDKILVQELSGLQEELRQLFQQKQKQVLPMIDLIQSITEGRNHKGKYVTRSALQKQIGELGKLAPGLIEIKTFKGRQMIRFKNKPSCEVID
jgi:hypothetical protein